MIDFERVYKREDTTADFSPPRHAMINDDADFDWDEDIDIDESDLRRQTPTGNRFRLSMPFKDINPTENAKRLARTLFYSLQGSRDHLLVQDFNPYFDTEEDAYYAFNLFDKDSNGDI
ncbi:hypothetical protein BGZ82_009459 [Podila clonocystis]|nr:hypothetical protein BGZ82_009459 [Podila clonocystis]